VLILSLVTRKIFNFKIPPEVNQITVDNFLFIDVLFAISSAGVFTYITRVIDYKVMMNEKQKDFIDYLVALVFGLSWIRFFQYFLIIPSISKMILTLISMLIDVNPFLSLMIIYLMFSTQFFSTMFQDINEIYSTIWDSM
jgi:branched-subunit amino acid transport protein AzlD